MEKGKKPKIMAKTFDISLDLKNYKLLKDKEFNLKGFNVLIVEGPNESGKTSLRTMLKEQWTARSLTEEPLTTGEEQGTVKATIPDKHGNPITIIHNFNKFDQKGSFYAIDEDGKPIKSAGKIRELLGGIEMLSIHEIWEHTKSLPGIRKLQDNFLMKCLTDEEIKKLDAIDSRINPNSGTAFLNRRDLARDKVKLLQAVESITITEEQQQQLEIIEKVEANVKEIETELQQVDLVGKDIELIQQAIKTLADEKAAIPDDIVGEKARLERWITRREEEIKKAEEDIRNWKAEIESSQKELEVVEETANKRIAEIDKEIAIKQQKVPKDVVSKDALEQRLAKGKAFLEETIRIKTLAEEKKSKQEELTKVTEQWKEADESIRLDRETKADILAKSKLPGGISMEEDDITINGLPLRESQISETTVKVAFIELACQISEGKLIDGGSASDYGHERLKAISDIAGKYNKLLVLEKVNDDIGEVRIVGYIHE